MSRFFLAIIAMQFRVSIPPHVKSGQSIRIRCPDGTEGDVKVPKGLKGGDSFIFEMPKQTTKASSKIQSLQNLLDQDISTLNDFAVAVAIGVIIGLSIVTGFVMGILYVTDAEEELGQCSQCSTCNAGS